MARLIGPSEASREVKTIVTSAGVTKGLFKSKATRPATFYVDQAATTPADILLADGTPVVDGEVTIDAYSMLPLIQFPDGVDTLYVVVDGGPAWPVYAREDDQFDALEAAVQTAQSTASGALVKTANLSDLGNASTARTNLGLGTAATKNVGTASGDVAAGDAPATAQAAAISAAATDATTKANAAQAAAVQRANHTGTQSADTLTDGTTNKVFLSTERTKLAGIATGATANSTDAQLRDRSTHTGTQAVGTITGLGGAATLNVGTAAGTVAAGNDSRITGAVQKTGYTGEKTFPVTFSTAANEKLDLYWTGATNGVLVVTLTGNFTGQNAYGCIRVTYTLSGLSNGTTFTNVQTPIVSEGVLPDEYALMPAAWDAVNSRWRIRIAHRTTNANPILAHVAWQQTTQAGSTALESMTASAVFTTDTTPGVALSPAHRTHTRATGEILATDPYFGTAGTKAAFTNAVQAAEALGRNTVVRIPAGTTIDVVDTFSLSGLSCQIIGAGAGLSAGSTPQTSVITASAQAGPVVNLEGYNYPSNFLGKTRPLAQLIVKGSGVADATKANVGVRIKKMQSAYFHDISIIGTGGACLYLAESAGDACYLSDFERFVFGTPVGATANDVPWLYINEGNGNRFKDFGFRSLVGSDDMGISGAVIIENNATYAPYFNSFYSWWFEFLHIPNGGVMINHKGNYSRFFDFQFHDVVNYAEFPTAGSYLRLDKPAVNDSGGNEYIGYIPASGIDVRQSGNRISGGKAYPGKNIMLAAGVNYTYAHLGGGAADRPMPSNGFIDNSGTTTNVLIDDYDGTEVRGGQLTRQGHASVNTFMANQAEPATPVGGGITYVQDGAYKYKGSSGTVTVIGPA